MFPIGTLKDMRDYWVFLIPRDKFVRFITKILIPFVIGRNDKILSLFLELLVPYFISTSTIGI